MIINPLAVILSFVTTLFMGWFFMTHFRKLKTGVKSPFIPDGKTLSQDKKTTGVAFACLAGCLVGFLGTAFLAETEMLPVMLSSGIFLMAMCFLGYKDDKKLDLSGENVGINAQNRLVFTMVVALSFGIICMATGSDTVVSLPLSREKLRLGGAFGPAVALTTLVACEGERATGSKNNTEFLRGIVKLTAILFVAAVEEKIPLMLLPSVYIGTLVGGLFWSNYKKVLKIGFSDKYIITAMILTACFATENEGMILFLFAFEIFCLFAYPADRLFYKLSGKHIFNRLPVDEHLKSSEISDKKIKILYVLFTAIFALTAVAAKLILLKTE
ncbi:MAG: hypothetical protein E7509_01495 [Ruminococcus sp.]|nr:hypothetical protein [Ruminococcus sp.]